MKKGKATDVLGIRTVEELKKIIIAHALLTGNTFAFHGLFAGLKEFAKGGDDSEVNPALMNHVGHFLPTRDTADSEDFQAALRIVEKHDLKGDVVSADLLEETARQAVAQEKFAYAEDAYRLLGIKKEMVALYAQRGEQFLREAKPTQAALSFLVSASIDKPLGPNFQTLGPQLHARCLQQPKACVTGLPADDLVDRAIHFLLAHETLSERLVTATPADQKRSVVGALAKYRDENIRDLVANLRAAAEAFSAIHNGKPDEYLALGPLILGHPTTTGQSWQYLRELSYQHPIGALCVCLRPIREKTILIPIVREGNSLVEFLLPPSMLSKA